MIDHRQEPQQALRKDFTGASMLQISTEAGQGNPYALLAYALRCGESLNADDQEAVLRCIRQARELLLKREGDPDAVPALAEGSRSLGRRFEQRGDIARAFACYKEAGELDPRFAGELIRCYEQGLGCEKDPAEARRLREEKARRGGIRERYAIAEQLLGGGMGLRAVEWLQLSLAAEDGESAPALRSFIRCLLSRVSQGDERGEIPDEAEEQEELQSLLDRGSAEAAFYLARLAGTEDERRALLRTGLHCWPEEYARLCQQELEKPQDAPASPEEPAPETAKKASREERELRRLRQKRDRTARKLNVTNWLSYWSDQRSPVLELLCAAILVGAVLITLSSGSGGIGDFARPGSYSGACTRADGWQLQAAMLVGEPDGDGDLPARLEIAPFPSEAGESADYSGYLCIQDGHPGFSVQTPEGLRQLYRLDRNPDATLRLEAAESPDQRSPMRELPLVELYLAGSEARRAWERGLGESGQSDQLLMDDLSPQGLEIISPLSPNRIVLADGTGHAGGLVLSEGEGSLSLPLGGRYRSLELRFAPLEGGQGSLRIEADGQILLEGETGDRALSEPVTLNLAGLGSLEIRLEGQKLALTDLRLR